MAGHADKVQVKYDELATIAQTFSTLTDKASDLRSRSLRQMDVLKSGAWIGEGASKFYAEMEDRMFPALDRLEHALSSTSAVVRRASEMYTQAEQTAAGLFKGEGGGLNAGGGRSGGGTATSGGGSTASGGGRSGGGTATSGGGSTTSTGGGKQPTDFTPVTTVLSQTADKIIGNSDRISNLARLFAGGNKAGAVDDLVNLGRKLHVEEWLSKGAKVLGGGAGGVIDFAFLPSEQQNLETFGVQLTSGLIQGAVTLNPVGATIMAGHTIVQLAGWGLIEGGEKFGEVFDVDTRGFVDGVRTVKETLNIDQHLDTIIQGVVNISQDAIDKLF